MPASETVAERLSPRQRMALAVLACTITAIVAAPLSELLDLANMVMLFLLTVLLVAVSLGRNPAVLAAVLSVVLFDVFFVPPRFSLAVSNLQYLITFAVMLATALITGHLAASLKEQARDAESREQRTRALYEIAGKLAGALNLEQVAEIVRHFVASELGGDICLQLAAPADESPAGRSPWFDPALALRAQETGCRVAAADPRDALYLPLTAPMRGRGVLAVHFADQRRPQAAENRALLDALASLVAIAVERLHYVEIAQSTEVKMATERLRSSILSALSHDLRTPLTVLVGLADSLFLVQPALPGAALDTAAALREQAARLAGLVTNLLDMARLNAGSVSLRQEWQPIEEVIGSSLKLLGSALATHRVEIDLPPDLPLLRFDAVLIERVLCNLLENAAKYSPAGTAIGIVVHPAGDMVDIAVCDRGPGFPAGGDGPLFEMFVRGQPESDQPGTGLGLAICRAIVEAHHGRIRVDGRADGGACVVFSLPRGVPPVLEAELP
jgi:two-component system sensor histidine kinase KdpD